MTESPAWQTITSPTDPPITDQFGNQWSMATNHRLLVNGQLDRGAAYIQKITYAGHMIWIYVGQWWYKLHINDTWSLADGPPVDHGDTTGPVPDPRIDVLIGLVNTLITKVDAMSGTVNQLQTEIDQLMTDVTSQTAVIQSAQTMIGGFSQTLKDAIAAASSAGATPDQLAQLNALDSSINLNSTKLAAAIAANTPAAPADPSTPTTPAAPDPNNPVPTDPSAPATPTTP